MATKKVIFIIFNILVLITVILVSFNGSVKNVAFHHLTKIAEKIIPFSRSDDKSPSDAYMTLDKVSRSYFSEKCNITERYSLQMASRPRLYHHYVNTIPTHMWTTRDLHGNTIISSDVPNNKLAEQLTLQRYAIPSAVHFLWCDGYFTLNHYLSIISVHKLLRPSRIIFHCVSEPQLDRKGYYSYYGEILRDIPNFYVEKMKTNKNICGGENKNKVLFMADILSKAGGIYLSEKCIISKSLATLRNKKMVSSFRDNFDGFMMMAPNYMDTTDSNSKVEAIRKGEYVACASPTSFTLRDSMCVCSKKEILPFHEFKNGTDLAQLIRWLYYGQSAPMKSISSKKTVVPLLAHYVSFGIRTFSFLQYVSVLSCLHVLNARVYIHGNPEPQGKYWEKLKQDKRVKFIMRDNIESYFGYKIYHVSHPSDLVRLDVLSRYGGVYLDLDAVWANPLPDNLRQYDFVASVNFGTQKPYPYVFNFGVIMAKQGAEVIKHSLELYRHFLVRDRPYNPIEMLYKVYEKNPDEIFVEPHLQIICLEGKCHPTWIEGHLNRSLNHLNKLKFDWKTEALALHWVYPDPGEFSSEETLRKSKGMFADIGRHIMTKAGLW